MPINTPPPKHKIPETIVLVNGDMTSPVEDCVKVFKPSFLTITSGNNPRKIETNPRTDIVNNLDSSKFIFSSCDEGS